CVKAGARGQRRGLNFGKMTTSLTIADEGMAKHSTTNPHITVFTADGEIQIPIYKLGDGRFCVTWYEPATGALTKLRKRQRPDAVKIARQVCARRATRYRLALPIDVYYKLEAQKGET